MSDSRRRDPRTRPAPEAREGGVGRARQLLDRIGGLARQARDSAERLAERLLNQGPGRRGSTAGVDSGPAKSREGRERQPGERPRGPTGEPSRERSDEPSASRTQGDSADPRPVERGETRVVLLSRDPAWLFCYWNIAAAVREEAQGGGDRLTLRLHDVTDIEFDGINGWSQHLYPLTEEARWWHVPVPHGGRHYLAEVGYCSRSGAFRPLAHSESVATLSHAQAPSAEVELATVSMDEPLTDPAPHPFGVAGDPGADVTGPWGDPGAGAAPAGGALHRPAAGPDEAPPETGDHRGATGVRPPAVPTSGLGGAEPTAGYSSAGLSGAGSSAPWSRPR